MRLLLAIAIALASLAGCSSSPASPTDPEAACVIFGHQGPNGSWRPEGSPMCRKPFGDPQCVMFGQRLEDGSWIAEGDPLCAPP